MRPAPARPWLYGWLILFIAGIVGLAFSHVPMQDTRRCSTDIAADEDIAQALAYGSAFTGDAWQQVYADHEGENVSVRWVDDAAIGHLDYLRYNCGLTRADMEQYRFDISLGGYDSWHETLQCEMDGLMLHEFSVVYAGEDYLTRFWLEKVNDTRLAAFQLSFPASRASDLDMYAARLYPQLSACPAD